MAKKRKQELGANEGSQPQKKQQQVLKQKQKLEEENMIAEAVQEETEEVVEEVEEVEEEESGGEQSGEEEEEEVEEEEQEEQEEEEEEEGGEDQSLANQVSSSSAADANQHGYDEDDEPIEKLLEPFGKEQLLILLKEAADNHHDVAERIRTIADQDPVHRKIFVHGLGWDTTAETLIDAFKVYGEIEDCKAVSDKMSGKSKGYGFILFKRRGGARKALKEPQKKIGNRMTACQLASIGPVPPPGMTQPAFPAQQTSEYTQRKIYVSNVGADLDPQKLTAFFAKFGEIEEGPLGLDKMTGKPKGFCLYVYRTVESAKRALEEPHKNFEGNILHCQKAIDGPKPGKAQKPQRTPHHNMHNAHFQPHNVGAAAVGSGHLMAPAGRPAAGYNQAPAATPALTPALGQALTALLAAPGAGLGLTNFLGTLGSVAGVNQGGVPGSGPGVPTTYSNQATMTQGMVGAYGNQAGMQGGYPNQPVAPGGAGRGPHVGPYGGSAPYMGH